MDYLLKGYILYVSQKIFLYAQRGISPLFILSQSLNYTSCLSSGLENFNSLREKLLSVLCALITMILSSIFPLPTLGAALLTVPSGSQPSQSLLIMESLILVTIIQSLLFKNVSLLFNLLKHLSSFSTDQPCPAAQECVYMCVCVAQFALSYTSFLSSFLPLWCRGKEEQKNRPSACNFSAKSLQVVRALPVHAHLTSDPFLSSVLCSLLCDC